jgi:lysozyme family protein
MAASSYDAALARLLAHEGGYTNHPSDPGGPTNFGITINDYRRYVKPGATAADVRAMPIADAKAIYKAHYWDAMRCDELPAGLDYAVFDYGVNSGIGRAVKVLQRLVGAAVDARMTDALLVLVARRDAADLIGRLCDERLAFLKHLKTWPVFGSGWSRRVGEVRTAALAMAKAAENAKANGGDGRARNGIAAAVVTAGAAIARWAHQSGAHPFATAGILLAAVAFAAWA